MRELAEHVLWPQELKGKTDTYQPDVYNEGISARTARLAHVDSAGCISTAYNYVDADTPNPHELRERESYESPIMFDEDGYPLNPRGRTGLRAPQGPRALRLWQD